LDNLPKTLDETYARILENIPEENMEDATTILRLLTCSERPLHLEELIDAIAVQPDVRPSFDPDNRMPEPRDILRICSSLVTLVQSPLDRFGDVAVDTHSDDVEGRRTTTKLQLAHFSVKEYLISDRISPSFSTLLAEQTARASIATLCLAYLPDLDHSLPLVELRARFGFSQYCAKYWAVHAKVVDGVDEGLQTRIMEFLNDNQNGYLTCYNLCDPDPRWFEDKRTERVEKPAPLYYMSLTGLTTSVRLLLDGDADVSAQGVRVECTAAHCKQLQ
jgi:hypothetical protein